MTTDDETHGDRVKRRILEMGLQLWRVDASYVTARRIAHELGISHGTVFYHFKTSYALRDAVAYHAVEQGESRVIAQLIMSQHKAAAHMDAAQRLAVLREAAG